MTPQGHFRVLKCYTSLKYSLHTTRTLCVVLTLLSFIAAEILNTRVSNQVSPGNRSTYPAPLALDAILKYILQSLKHSISKFTSEVFGKAGILYSLAQGNTQTKWIWQPFWYLGICFSAHQLCFVFKTEQGQDICLRVDICLCWALFHESQVSVTDLRQILQFTGKKWGHQHIVRYWRHTAFIRQ